MAALFGAVVTLGAVYVWPTPYRDIPLERAPAWLFAARENRFTGAVDGLTAAGWLRLERRTPVALAAEATPATTHDDPLADYRPDWRGYVPRDTGRTRGRLRLNVVPGAR